MGCLCSKTAEDVSGACLLNAWMFISIFVSKGEVGQQGYIGPQGPPGSKVRVLSFISRNSASKATVCAVLQSFKISVCLQGEQGETGPQGDRGTDGLPGLKVREAFYFTLNLKHTGPVSQTRLSLSLVKLGYLSHLN